MALIALSSCAAAVAQRTSRTRTAREIAADLAAEGSALLAEFRYREAFQRYEQAFAVDPDDREIAKRHDVLVWLGGCTRHPLAADHARARELVARGRDHAAALRFRDAVDAFDDALEADPANEDARRWSERFRRLVEPGPGAPRDSLRASLERMRERHHRSISDQLVEASRLLDEGKRVQALTAAERVREALRWYPYDERELSARADELYLAAKRTP